MLVLLLVVLATGMAFAQSVVSAGIGGTFRANFQNVVWTKTGRDYLNAMGISKNISDSDLIGGGFFAFFDVKYLALSVGMGFQDVSPVNKDMKKMMRDEKVKETFTTLDIGLMLKIPIDMGEVFTLFPAFGVDFRIALEHEATVDGTTYKYSDDNNPADDMTRVWFKLGLGADIPLGDTLYLRPMFLYGFGTLSNNEKDYEDRINETVKFGEIINHGLDFSLALGFKF